MGAIFPTRLFASSRRAINKINKAGKNRKNHDSISSAQKTIFTIRVRYSTRISQSRFLRSRRFYRDRFAREYGRHLCRCTWIAHNPLFPPANPVLHTAVWTGSEMIVWGGHIANSPFETNTGGRYNPGTDSWTTTSTATQYNGLVASLRDVPVSGSRPGAVATLSKHSIIRQCHG